mmetsp:Transcript_8599/g.17415  ORF Transcript_8599/g.17415 Transcript_8599/m.17415 type:complete len:453 (-) Transcript_8599:115-1473(-)
MDDIYDREGSISLLERSWRRADWVFDEVVPVAALYEKPIDLRHPFLFYMGHLPSFACSIARKRLSDAISFNHYFDDIFERGMDPDVEDPSKCHDHPEEPQEWPEVTKVKEYLRQVREWLGQLMPQLVPTGDLALIVEHDLMHVETLLYMVAQLDGSILLRKLLISDGALDTGSSSVHWISIPEGSAVLGTAREMAGEFRWDIELAEDTHHVPAFSIGQYPVTIGEFLEFVENDGYATESLWTADDWTWREKHAIAHPKSWCRRDGQWEFQGAMHRAWLSGTVLRWPVFVSLAEARAYARWRDARLPSEAEWHRAAFYSPDRSERPRKHPWGDAPPVGGHHGNFDFSHLHPTPVDAHPEGASAFDVHDLVGNGWELCDTVLGPLPGFEPDTRYPGYAADFFDKKHFIVKGASWATDIQLIRQSFKNWYQSHYPYVFSKFRLCRQEGSDSKETA